MVSEETLYKFVGREPFDKARKLKTATFWSPGQKEQMIKEVIEETAKELDSKMLLTGCMAAHMRAEYLDSLTFHIKENADVFIPSDELMRLTSEKNIDGTSSYLPNEW